MTDHPAEGTILPCPFCGNEPTVMGSGEGRRGLMIHCIGQNCPNPSVSYYNHADARAVWNRRAAHSQGGSGEPAAWLVGWHRANGDAGLKAYVNENDARRAAKNLEAYSASETMTDVQPLYATPLPSPAESNDDWKDDPSSDERWNAGVDFAMVQLCRALDVDPKKVNWDAATETLDGDMQAVVWNILRVRFGEEWEPPPFPGDVSPAGSATTWQPIKTAPKDGTPIEAVNSRHADIHPPVIVRWHADEDPHWCDAATVAGDALYFNPDYFDYWKPVSAFPREEGSGA